ncbi:putative hydroxymethylpyrimidine transporter CytX [Roseiarcaceae bacterium H3SJ34-1]|uniref:putative hydroxymethylpyrimidine transporter CytX n=1 Tax=Terripilifer ovatus TaxID=3032367 RepID=UPI003AB9913B|nr:putative hydroxymethylpyrimidine transporter CytX [Roseiarcaceae bacterium H3SJ34-1]
MSAFEAQENSRATYAPLSPVPQEKRAFAMRDAFALWFSLGIGLLVLQAGALLVPGLSLGMALAAIVAGSLLGVLLLAAAGVVGADTGLSSMANLRPALGVRGASIAAILNAVQLAGWGAFEIVAMRDAADALAQQNFGVSNAIVWTVLFGALATGLAVMGPLSFVKKFLRDWGLLLLLAGAAWLTWRLMANYDLKALFAKAGSGEMTVAGGVDLVISMPLSWLPLIADYTRFGKTPGAMFRGSFFGYLIANIWFFSLGAAYALASGGEGLLLSALAATGGGIALLLILIDETDNAFADIFSAAMSTSTLIGGGVTRLSIVYGVLCTAIAIAVPLASYETFLLMIGSVFAPLFGILLTDHFIVRRRQIDASAIAAAGGRYWFNGGWHVRGLLAWALGIAAYQLVAIYMPAWGATLPAFALAGIFYAALMAPGREWKTV